MSRQYREPVEPEEYVLCDICGGEIHGDGMSHPFDDEVDFHEECWNNAPEWVEDCPPSLFNGEHSYGEYVEAVRGEKCILFIEGEDRYPTICDNRESAEDLLCEMNADDSINGIVINGEYHAAYEVTKLHISGLDED